MQEGLVQRDAKGAGGGAEVGQRVADMFKRFKAHETGHGKGQFGEDPTVLDDDETAFDL